MPHVVEVEPVSSTYSTTQSTLQSIITATHAYHNQTVLVSNDFPLNWSNAEKKIADGVVMAVGEA